MNPTTGHGQRRGRLRAAAGALCLLAGALDRKSVV